MPDMEIISNVSSEMFTHVGQFELFKAFVQTGSRVKFGFFV